MSCDSLECYGTGECCQVTPEGEAYCLVESQCRSNPVWESAVIPAVLFLAAVILILVVCLKFRRARIHPMKVSNYAHHEIRMEPKLSDGRLQTITTLT